MPWDFGQKSAFAEKNREQQQVGFFLEYVSISGQQRNPQYHPLAEIEWFPNLAQIQILENARKDKGRLRTKQSSI
jgi:hypothetical protein